MEKYYCEKCRVLYIEDTICKICGMPADKKILIYVQNQDQSNKK